ncbi:hypothetical protein H6G45_10805 [Synechocystis sp. FACHB-383]|uniref:hypothetical protein n=1 Tax=Synechocystis sp. FACHB-383 TaxID=2692864 RepID=UPI001681CB11|nr:hypothetical protein [Synechocystis sp. FACHB-383]MBD2653968.1 hypothetical protein [Synechocystis sp. FACHB-383]
MTSVFETIKYVISSTSGQIFEGYEQNLNFNSCNYDPPQGYSYCAEIILKSKQTPVKPGRVSSSDPQPVQDGEWWISKGIEYPSFDPMSYQIDQVEVVNRELGQTKWIIE